MRRRTGLGRRGRLEGETGDPLDGLVNLFDIGIVLAVAFLVAGLTLTFNATTGKVESRPLQASPEQNQEQAIPDPSSAPPASGNGEEVGKVYRLPDGRLVYVEGR